MAALNGRYASSFNPVFPMYAPETIQVCATWRCTVKFQEFIYVVGRSRLCVLKRPLIGKVNVKADGSTNAGGAVAPTLENGFVRLPLVKARRPPTNGGFSCAIESVL